MAAADIEAIENNAKYKRLVAARASLGATLSALVCVIYFGFILLVAFAPGFLGGLVDGRRHDRRHCRGKSWSSSPRSC